jgi:major membrane immunogen (membrane-anchored lipoprotein)
MIRKTIITLSMLLLLAFSCEGPYKNGNYRGSSRAGYTNEPYYGYSNITVKKGKIVKVEFFIRDSSKHEIFDDKYERYFAGNDEYIQQCRNDRKGILSYPDSLLKYQDLNKVDAISGATWSYNIFKSSAQNALASAQKVK